MLGMSKLFVIVLAICAIIGYGTHNIYNFFSLMLLYVIFRVIYNILT
jgi:hypothetical protein